MGAAATGAAAMLLPTPASASQVGPSASDLADFRRLASGYLGDRARRVTAIRPSASQLPGLRLSAGHLRSYRADVERLDQVRDTLDTMHGGYVKSSTVVTVEGVKVDGLVATMRATEQTDLYFVDTSAGVASTAYRASHGLTMHRSASGWLLGESAYQAGGVASLPVTQFDDRAVFFAELTAAERASMARRPDAKNVGALAPSAGYNYQAMVNYARAWAFGRNSAYPTYPNDCTNFVSQVMHAGGWAIILHWDRPNNNYWWYGITPSTSSYTWGAGQNLHYFGLNSGRTYVMANPWDMGIGDILMYDQDQNWEIDHSQVCTGRNSAGPLMTQHTSDYRDKPLGEVGAYPTSRTYAHRT